METRTYSTTRIYSDVILDAEQCIRASRRDPALPRLRSRPKVIELAVRILREVLEGKRLVQTREEAQADHLSIWRAAADLFQGILEHRGIQARVRVEVRSTDTEGRQTISLTVNEENGSDVLVYHPALPTPNLHPTDKTPVSIVAAGDTLRVRTPYHGDFPEKIKALGGKWNPVAKHWSVPLGHEERVRELVNEFFGPEA